MSTTTAAARRTATDLSDRRVPPLGGFNPTLLGLEMRRMLRNRRTMIFTMIMPIVFYLIFGLSIKAGDQSLGAGSHGNVSAYVLISMALYGAVLATSAGGAMVSIERSAGWSRQLRLTPLSPVAYIVTKMFTAMLLGAASVAAVFVVGAITGAAQMTFGAWVLCAVATWVGSLMFAAFGLFMGYLLPTENVMQIQSFALVIFAFAGGLFLDLTTMPGWYQTLAQFTPLWGLNELVHAPVAGSVDNLAWLNVAAWLAVFVAGATWRFRKDTARV
ncbi:MAG TPA: ABC transporter permease [Segeticoccus sp.]|nr:ABC transporter permease [Segeticoccus sp.]